MVLDHAMPSWDHRSRHTVWAELPPSALLAAVDDLEWREVPVFRLLLTLRGLADPQVRSDARVLAWFGSNGFREIARTDEEILTVSVQPVRRGRRATTPSSIEAFRAYLEPGCIKIAFNFSTRDGILVTETRVLATDAHAHRLFSMYWLAIRAGSGMIRRVWLRAIRARAREAISKE